jgi:uncharacterized protein YndB with AHSA1/START domain
MLLKDTVINKEPVMQNTIVREITVKATKEKVYKAITDPEQITTWFPDSIEGSLEVGQQPVFTFSKQNHKSRIYVEAAKPFEYFAYRWVPGAAGTADDVLSVPNTLVEFHIEELKNGSKIILKESGFASLPSEVAEKSFNENSGGWGFMMGRLEKAMNQS